MTFAVRGIPLLAGAIMICIAAGCASHARGAITQGMQPCVEPSQLARAANPRPGDSVSAPLPRQLFNLPATPNRESVSVNARFVVDSVGKARERTFTFSGYNTPSYQRQVETLFDGITFRPAVLFPDRCTVSGVALITALRR